VSQNVDVHIRRIQLGPGAEDYIDTVMASATVFDHASNPLSSFDQPQAVANQTFGFNALMPQEAICRQLLGENLIATIDAILCQSWACGQTGPTIAAQGASVVATYTNSICPQLRYCCGPEMLL
jgi:hypothetical protein